jgi:hypothetical protein
MPLNGVSWTSRALYGVPGSLVALDGVHWPQWYSLALHIPP